MPKLEIPGENPVRPSGGISITGGAESVLPLTKAGNAQMELGRSMIAEGASLADKANQAMSEALVQDKYSRAATEFNQLVIDEESKGFDDNGNPIFNTLPNRIQDRANQLSSKYTTGMSPEAQSEFNSRWNTLTTNRVIQSQTTARQQQIQYSQGTIASYGQSLYQDALKDTPDNIGLYETQYNSAIDKQVTSGLIPYDDGQKMKSTFSNNTRIGHFNVQIKNDPYSAKFVLENRTDKELGIDEQQRLQLIDSANTRISGVERQKAQIQKEQQAVVARQQSLKDLNVEIGIESGKISNQQDIDEMFQNNELSLEQYKSRTLQLNKKQAKDNKNVERMIEMQNDLKTNGMLTPGKYTDTEIKTSYISIKNGLRKPDGTPASIIDSVQAALTHRGVPVKQHTDELSQTLQLATDANKVVEAAKAYEIGSARDPIVYSKMDSKAARLAADISMKAKLYPGGVPIEEVTKSRNAVYAMDQSLFKNRNDEFKKIVAAKATKTNVDGTQVKVDGRQALVKEVIDDIGLDSDSIDAATMASLGTMLETEYTQSNLPMDSVKQAFKYKIQGVVGETSLMSPNGDEVTTLFPPEKFIQGSNGQTYTSDEIREMLQYNLDDIQIDNPNYPSGTISAYNPDSGLNEDQIVPKSASEFTLEAYPETSRTALPGQSAKYLVTYQDAEGNKQYLLNADGTFVEFKPDSETTGYVDALRKDAALTPAELQQYGEQGLPTGDRTGSQSLYQSLTSKTVNTVGQIESNNNYSAINSSTGALGKYQILPDNVASWSQEALGRQVSRDEFLRNPEIQDKIATYKLNQYVQKYGPVGAAAAWHSGETGMKNLGPNGRHYVEKFKSSYNRTITATNKSGATPFSIAKSMLGTSERKHAKVISNFIKNATGRDLNPIKTAWCAAFVNSALASAGLPTTGSLAARSFLNYGTPTATPVQGDIVVFSRPGAGPNAGHVGFYAGSDGDSILVLGGNQSDQVSIKRYPKSRLLGIRKPPEVK